VILSRGGRFLPDHFRGLTAPAPESPARKPRSLKDLEKEYLQSLIAASGGDMKKVAETLDVSRATLYRKLKDLREGA
jgi:DNA-binding NtrC family response regulator